MLSSMVPTARLGKVQSTGSICCSPGQFWHAKQAGFAGCLFLGDRPWRLTAHCRSLIHALILVQLPSLICVSEDEVVKAIKISYIGTLPSVWSRWAVWKNLGVFQG